MIPRKKKLTKFTHYSGTNIYVVTAAWPTVYKIITDYKMPLFIRCTHFRDVKMWKIFILIKDGTSFNSCF